MAAKMFPLLAIALSLPATAGVRTHAFTVGAIVIRSAAVRVQSLGGDARRVRLEGARAMVQIDASAPEVAAGEVPLPSGVTRVTVNY